MPATQRRRYRNTRSHEIQKKKKSGPKQKKSDVKKKGIEKPFGKKGQTRIVGKRTPSFYPTERIRRPRYQRPANSVPPRIRNSLQPGTVLILLAGRFRGKRVILLNVLKSSLLLITGPYKVNGVPLRRVNSRYVIATSTRVEIPEIDILNVLDDNYFRKPKKDKKKKKATAEDFFEGKEKQKEKKEFPPERAEHQKHVDELILPKIQEVPHLRAYLRTHFSLSNGQYPHLMKF